MNPDLSVRELEVLIGMSQGLTNEQIGTSLGLRVDTIKSHARRIFQKLDAHDRAHAVAQGFRRGYLPLHWEAAA